MHLIFSLLCAVSLAISPLLLAAEKTLELPHEIYILPDSIPMWPPVWWTWLLMAAVLIALIFISITFIQRHTKNAYRREAINLLMNTHTINDAALLMLCHQTIRRCLVTKKRHDLASLPSHTLFDRLDKQNKDSMKFANLGNKFMTGAYQPELHLSHAEREQIVATTKYWCRSHHA